MIRLCTAGGGRQADRRNSGSRPGQAYDSRGSARLDHRKTSATQSGRSEALRGTPVGTVTAASDAPDQRIPRTFSRDRDSPSTPTTARRLDARVGDEVYRMRASGGSENNRDNPDEEHSRSPARWRSLTRA
jgi:hypothetical protein